MPKAGFGGPAHNSSHIAVVAGRAMNKTNGASRPFTGLATAGQLGAGLPGSRVPTRLAHPERARLRPPHHPAPLAQPAEPDAAGIRFHQLATAFDIARVQHLRRELQLNVADPAGFAMLEKKEMRRALSARSSFMDNSSAPSASCRSAPASPPATRFSPGPRWTPACCAAPGK